MTKKEKEEERIERIIRGLLKLPENRRCINCNSLGPQYVCITFLTFVCTNCSGVHREFTHRVKSVSMAKFNAEEVSALQAGGNERARQIYFKNWDIQRNSYPDGSNLHRLRDFIKHVYVDRKYSGDKTQDRLPRLRMIDKEEFLNRKTSLYSGGVRSPNYEDRRSRPSGRSDDRGLKFYFDERRSPRYSEENSRYGGFRRSPARFEVVDDRFRDGGIRSGRDDNRRVSVDGRKNVHRSGSPVGRPVRNAVVGEHSKATEADGSACSQIASSSSKRSIDGKEVRERSQSLDSLIDFNAHSTLSDAAVTPPTQDQSSNEGKCDSNESSKKQDAPPVLKPNTLEFLLHELSFPSVEPVGGTSDLTNNDNHPAVSEGSALTSTAGILGSVPQAQLSSLPSNNGPPTNVPAVNVPIADTADDSSAPSMEQMSTSSDITHASKPASGDGIFIGDVSLAAPAEKALSLLDSFDVAPSATSITVQTSDRGTLQAQPSAFPTADTGSSGQQRSITADGIVNNQPWSSTISAEHPHQVVSKAGQDSNFSLKTQQLYAETKSGGRQELPVDLFTASFSSVPGSVPDWQSSAPYRMGYNNMQYYPNAMPVQPYPHQCQAKPINPFDYNNNALPMQVSPFPSMENLRIASPNMSVPAALSRTSSMDTNSPALMAAQAPSYASAMPLQTPAGAYMGQQQQHLNTSLSRPQVRGGFGGDAFFGFPNMVQQSSGGYPLSSPPDSLPSAGGNPFG